MITPLFQPALAGIALVPAAAAAAADWRRRRVPNGLLAVTLVPTVIAVIVAADRTHVLAGVGMGAAVMGLPLLLLHLVAPLAMGFGDVKLAAALGAGMGVCEPKLGVLALAAASGLTLLIAACKRLSAIPFAPGLVSGTAAALALGVFDGWRAAA